MQIFYKESISNSLKINKKNHEKIEGYEIQNSVFFSSPENRSKFEFQAIRKQYFDISISNTEIMKIRDFKTWLLFRLSKFSVKLAIVLGSESRTLLTTLSSFGSV